MARRLLGQEKIAAVLAGGVALRIPTSLGSGVSENCNKLIYQFFLKVTELTHVIKRDVQRGADNRNRLRKVPGFRSPSVWLIQ